MLYQWTYQTPAELDDLLMCSDGRVLTGLWFQGSRDSLKHEANGEAKRLPIFQEVERWLDQYFSGKVPDFTPKYKFKRMSPFRRRVLEILTEIPYGQTLTYFEIAQRIAAERGIEKMSSQAVGGAVGANPICLIVPCHRVIGKNGKMVGYGGGVANKIALLRHEGVIYV